MLAFTLQTFWMEDHFCVTCLSEDGRADGPGDQSRESRPAGPNFNQLLSSSDLMMCGRWS